MQRRALLKLLGLAAAAQWERSSSASSGGHVPPPDSVSAPPQFFFNQVGYLPGKSKEATIVCGDGDDLTFRLRSVLDGAVAYRSTLTEAKADAASGDVVRQANFSSFHAPGRYRLEVRGHHSESFPIRPAVYSRPLRSAMRAFYGQRCGCSVDLGHGYKHPACHEVGEYHPSSGKSGSVRNAGGWHDAGDYGRYVVNSGITCGTLLWAWELYPQALRGMRLGIPKSHPHLPDFLAEVLWNLEWMMSLQDADGGVFHKQTSEKFCAFVMPQDDALPSEMIGTGNPPYRSTAATADLAAVMAIAARCYAPFDPALATRCLESARRAWSWAVANPSAVFKNPPGVSTGEYGDKDCSDEILWASAELWRTTGEKHYEEMFLGGLPKDRAALRSEAPSWARVASMACWTYVLADRAGDEDVHNAIRSATKRTAATLMERSTANGYGNTLAISGYGWGSNGSAAYHSMLLAVAHHLEPNEAAVSASLNNLHYLLGRNCHGVSWVTQVGTRPFLHPHHRPSGADKLSKPWPGLLSGGPNARPSDAVARTLPALPPMRMWLDDERAYSLNEVAINWNAPLVFLLAFANAKRMATKRLNV